VVTTLHNYRLTCANGLLYRDGARCELCVGSHPWNAIRYGCYRGSRVESLPAAVTIDLHRRLGTWTEQVDVLIALTEFQRDLMIQAGLPQDKITVKPNFVPDPGPRLAPPSGSNVVLYVGRLSAEKGVDLLVEAWRQTDTGPLELVIAGDGPLHDVMSRGLPSTVTLLGAISSEHVRRLMLSARALMLPSLWFEGMPMVLLEAFAAQLPAAVSAGGGPAQIVGAAIGPRWVFRSGDPASLSEALRKVRDNAWCDSSGGLAREAFETDFTDSRAAKRLLDIYQPLPSR